MTDIIEALYKLNPWYRTGSVPESRVEDFIRREFSDLRKDLDNTDLATLLIGGRRVGKSVIMYQLIQDLLAKGVDPKHILFIQGDNPILKEYDREGKMLGAVISTYEKYILSKDFQDLAEPVYIFIDEAQAIDKWDNEIKALLDLKFKLKFFITGSSSKKLRQGVSAPLLGRVNILVLPPFSFYDFYRFSVSKEEQQRLEKTLNALKATFATALQQGNYLDLKAVIEEAIKIFPKNLESKFEEYLYWGGYPWVVKYKGEEDTEKYLRDLLTMTISRDIVEYESARGTQSLGRIITNLALSIGCGFEERTLAERLGIDGRTFRKYIDYFIDAHLVYLPQEFAFNNRKVDTKKDHKAYVIDNGIVNSITMKTQQDIESERDYRGHLVENCLYGLLLHFKQQNTGIFQEYIPFWHNHNNQKEIDYIYEIDKGVIPIEVKARNSFSESDITEIIEFVGDKSKAKVGLVVTNPSTNCKELDGIIFVPSYVLAALL